MTDPIENNQYDPSAQNATNGMEDNDEFGPMGAPGNGPPGSGPPPGWSSGPNPTPGPPLSERSVGGSGNNGHTPHGPGSQDESKKQSPNISQ